MLTVVGLYYLLIGLFAISIRGRIIPLENRIAEQLVIDHIATHNIPVIPSLLTRDQSDSIEVKPKLFHKSVCYPVVGCYDNAEPYNNAAFEVPQSPEHIDTHFLLFTQEAPTVAQFLYYDGNDQSIEQSSLNASRWLRIIVHGFTNNRNSVWIKPLQDELFKLKDNELSDVLIVDWGNGAKFPYYPNAASNTRLVSKQLSLLLQKMHQIKGLSYDKIHCIGHSLGAHTCGLASNDINNQIGRISALDPAGPLFEGKDIAVRLDKTDAKFVDVIHSNTEIAFNVGFGSSDPSGHIDFYVNGGRHQPGCPTVNAVVGDVLTGHSEALFQETACSHARSYGYFTESINSECFYNAFPCHDYETFVNGQCISCSSSGCAQMGFHAIYSLGRGNMYLTTKSVSPFCGHHYLIELVLDHDMEATHGEILISIHSNLEMLTNVSLTSQDDAEIRPGDVLRHVFSFDTKFDKIDYAIVQFNKAKSFLGLGDQRGHDIVIANLRVKSMEDSSVYSAPCGIRSKITTHIAQTILLNRSDCDQ